jgi:hypothetical protein
MTTFTVVLLLGLYCDSIFFCLSKHERLLSQILCVIQATSTNACPPESDEFSHEAFNTFPLDNIGGNEGIKVIVRELAISYEQRKDNVNVE